MARMTNRAVVAGAAAVGPTLTPAGPAAGSDEGYNPCAGSLSKVATSGFGTGTQTHPKNGASTTAAYASDKARIWSLGYNTTANRKAHLSASIDMHGTYAYCPG